MREFLKHSVNHLLSYSHLKINTTMSQVAKDANYLWQICYNNQKMFCNLSIIIQVSNYFNLLQLQ